MSSAAVGPYQGDLAAGSCRFEVDDALVRGTAEVEARVFQVVDEGAVDEDVTDVQEGFFLRVLDDFVIGEARVDPDRFIGHGLFDVLDDLRQAVGVFHGFPAQEGQAAVGRGAEPGQELFHFLVRPFLSGPGVLVFRVETVEAVARAAGDENRRADARSIGNIILPHLCIMQVKSPLRYGGRGS